MAARRKVSTIRHHSMKEHGKWKMCMGLGILIFGLVKYLGYSWEVAFMVVGVLAFLYGSFLYSK